MTWDHLTVVRGIDTVSNRRADYVNAIQLADSDSDCVLPVMTVMVSINLESNLSQGLQKDLLRCEKY